MVEASENDSERSSLHRVARTVTQDALQSLLDARDVAKSVSATLSHNRHSRATSKAISLSSSQQIAADLLTAYYVTIDAQTLL